MCHQGCFPSEKKRDPMEEGTNRLDEELRQKEKLLLAVKDCVPACMSQCAPQCVKNGASPNVCAGECNSYCKRDCALEAKLGSNPLAGAKAAGDGSGDEFEFLSVDEAVDPKDSPKMDSRELGAAHCEPHCNDECNAECGKGYHSPHKCASECEASCAAYCAPLYATGRPVTPNLKLAPAAPGAAVKMLAALWSENAPPSIFGSMRSKAMPSAVARLANESDNVHNHGGSVKKAKTSSRWNDFWNK